VQSGQLNEALASYEKGAKIDPQQQLFAGDESYTYVDNIYMYV